MSFDWSDYLRLAETLYRDRSLPLPEEAALRTAISRAYYAAYTTARDFAVEADELVPTGKSTDHALVMRHFKSSSNPERRKIGRYLERLRDNRNAADYDSELPSKADSMAQSSIAQAQNTLDKLDSL